MTSYFWVKKNLNLKKASKILSKAFKNLLRHTENTVDQFVKCLDPGGHWGCKVQPACCIAKTVPMYSTIMLILPGKNKWSKHGISCFGSSGCWSDTFRNTGSYSVNETSVALQKRKYIAPWFVPYPALSNPFKLHRQAHQKLLSHNQIFTENPVGALFYWNWQYQVCWYCSSSGLVTFRYFQI